MGNAPGIWGGLPSPISLRLKLPMIGRNIDCGRCFSLSEMPSTSVASVPVEANDGGGETGRVSVGTTGADSESIPGEG